MRGQVLYGDTDLSLAVIAEREAQGLQYSVRNGAAVEYLEGGEARVKVMFSEYHVGHSEALLDAWLGEQGIGSDSVTRWYSEREPCALEGFDCRQMLAENYPNAQVTWTFPFTTQAEMNSARSDLLKALVHVFGERE